MSHWPFSCILPLPAFFAFSSSCILPCLSPLVCFFVSLLCLCLSVPRVISFVSLYLFRACLSNPLARFYPFVFAPFLLFSFSCYAPTIHHDQSSTCNVYPLFKRALLAANVRLFRGVPRK